MLIYRILIVILEIHEQDPGTILEYRKEENNDNYTNEENNSGCKETSILNGKF